MANGGVSVDAADLSQSFGGGLNLQLSRCLHQLHQQRNAILAPVAEWR